MHAAWGPSKVVQGVSGKASPRGQKLSRSCGEIALPCTNCSCYMCLVRDSVIAAIGSICDLIVARIEAWCLIGCTVLRVQLERLSAGHA